MKEKGKKTYNHISFQENRLARTVPDYPKVAPGGVP